MDWQRVKVLHTPLLELLFCSVSAEPGAGSTKAQIVEAQAMVPAGKQKSSFGEGEKAKKQPRVKSEKADTGERVG